jgi:hypothetical protein
MDEPDTDQAMNAAQGLNAYLEKLIVKKNADPGEDVLGKPAVEQFGTGAMSSQELSVLAQLQVRGGQLVVGASTAVRACSRLRSGRCGSSRPKPSAVSTRSGWMFDDVGGHLARSQISAGRRGGEPSDGVRFGWTPSGAPRGGGRRPGHGVVHPDLAQVRGLFREAVRHVDPGVVGGFQVPHRATAPTRPAVVSHSRPASASSKPVLPCRRTAG